MATKKSVAKESSAKKSTDKKTAAKNSGRKYSPAASESVEREMKAMEKGELTMVGAARR
jgi:hypothetical protein